MGTPQLTYGMALEVLPTKYPNAPWRAALEDFLKQFKIPVRPDTPVSREVVLSTRQLTVPLVATATFRKTPEGRSYLASMMYEWDNRTQEQQTTDGSRIAGQLRSALGSPRAVPVAGGNAMQYCIGRGQLAVVVKYVGRKTSVSFEELANPCPISSNVAQSLDKLALFEVTATASSAGHRFSQEAWPTPSVTESAGSTEAETLVRRSLAPGTNIHAQTICRAFGRTLFDRGFFRSTGVTTEVVDALDGFLYTYAARQILSLAEARPHEPKQIARAVVAELDRILRQR